MAVANGTSVMSYFSEAPIGTVQRTLYDTKGPFTYEVFTEGRGIKMTK